MINSQKNWRSIVSDTIDFFNDHSYFFSQFFLIKLILVALNKLVLIISCKNQLSLELLIGEMSCH